MPRDVYELVEKVVDEATFIDFVSALAEEWETAQYHEAADPASPYGLGALGWENPSLGRFLEAAASWGEASAEGLEGYEPPANPWRRVAHMLCAGKYYE